MLGRKTGGRVAGTPNRRTAELTQRLVELNCDPLEALVKIANDPATDVALRARIHAELLPYLYPKRKTVEISHAEAGVLLTSEQAEAMALAFIRQRAWHEPVAASVALLSDATTDRTIGPE